MKKLARALTVSILIALLCVNPPAVLAVETDAEAIETVEEKDDVQPGSKAEMAEAQSTTTTGQPTPQQSTYVTADEEMNQDECASTAADAAVEAPALAGTAHVQGLGWDSAGDNGEHLDGGQANLEALKISLSGTAARTFDRYSSLMCWLARGLGYDASVYCGRVPSAHGGLAAHGWVEVRYGGKTYVLDPDLQQNLPERDFYWKTYEEAPLDYYL